MTTVAAAHRDLAPDDDVSLDTPERDELLRSTRLIDAPPEEAFDRLTRIASNLLGAPTSTISLIQGGRQFFKSAVGLAEPIASARQTPLTHSFCKYVARDRKPLIVPDARAHATLRHSPALTENGVVAYAGMPLIVEDEAIGALCVIDTVPHQWSAEQLQLLQDLADVVMSEVALRRTLQRAEQQHALTQALLESLGDGVLAIDPRHRFLLANEAARKTFTSGVELGAPMPADWSARYRARRPTGAPMQTEDSALLRGMRGEATDDQVFTMLRPGAFEPSWIEVSGRPVRNAAGDIIASVAVYRDVTERTRIADRFRALVANIPRGAITLYDRDLICLAVDGTLLRELAQDRDAMIGVPLRTLVERGGGSFDGVEDMLRRTLAGESVTRDLAVGDRVYALHTTPVRDDRDRISAGMVLALDVTNERRVEANLRHSEQLHRAMVRNVPNGAVMLIDRNLRYVFADGPIINTILRNASITGLVGRTVGEVSADGNRSAVVEMVRATLRGERRQLEGRRGERAFEIRTVPVYDGDTITHALGFCYDITDRQREASELRRVRDQLGHQRALFETALAHIEDGVVLLDGERRVLFGNAAYANLFGIPRDRVEGLTRAEFLAHLAPMLAEPGDLALFEDPAATVVDEVVLARPHRVLRKTWSEVELPTGPGYLVTWHDATSEKALLAEREHQLHVDALTGIPNRRAAQAALKVETSRMRRTGHPLCVAVFDIDHFKRVNDTFGHAAGDRVLCQVALAMAGAARTTDLVARWGGEEFIAVLPADLAGARVFCERTRAMIERLPCPAVDRVTVSAGIAQLDPDEDPHDAIARADERLYEAKRAGRNRVIS